MSLKAWGYGLLFAIPMWVGIAAIFKSAVGG